MAGERIGKTYEALLYVVFDRLRSKGVFSVRVFWNETPEGVSVEPDILLGPDKDHPAVIIMVTHSGSSKNSDMKCWRNIGELCEAKTALVPTPLAINIIFDGIMKENLKALQAAVFDSQIIISDTDYGEMVRTWVYNHEPDLPANQEEKAECIKSRVDSDGILREIVKKLEKEIEHALQGEQSDLKQLWEMEAERPHTFRTIRKETYVRRGFTKRLLAGDAIHGGKVNIADGEWLSKLGLVHKSIDGFRIIDEELLWFLQTNFERRYKTIASLRMTDSFSEQIEKVRLFSLLDEYGKYVLCHYTELITTEGMRQCIVSQHENPCSGLELSENVKRPKTVWIYDYIAALIKAKEKKSQAFGYSVFSNHVLSRENYIGSMPVGQWCAHFACEYFNRREGFLLPEAAINLIATVLSEALESVPLSDIMRLRTEIEEQYIAKEFEAVLLTHRGFEPLLAILIDNKAVKVEDVINIRTCFAEKAELAGQAGKTTVAKVKHTIINWQSAYAGHPADKKKELCGRAVGLRYAWDQTNKIFIRRPGIAKLILLIDGTWQQQHIDSLIKAGWDEIYYPDQIDKLKAAIV